MSLEAAINLSIPELLRVLSEKLGQECTRVREIPLPPVLASIATLEVEVSNYTFGQSLSKATVTVSNGQPFQIESLEARVQDVLKLIPSLRNLLQPVNRLLPETLSRIARLTVNEDAIDTGSIVPLTHVCRYWRESIVSTPGNWTLVSSERFGLAGLSMERCLAVPLELGWTCPRSERIQGSLL